MIAALAAAALSWTTLTPATLQRTEVGAARVGRYAYVVGGFVAPGRTSAAVERYDLRRDRWARVRGLPFGLNHAAVAAYGGRLYVVGGYRARTAVAQESAALHAQGARRDRGRHARRSDRRRRRGGAGRHDRRGRGLRPRTPALERAARPAHAAPRPWGRGLPRRDLRARGRSVAGVGVQRRG